jgi:hypothetical protein
MTLCCPLSPGVPCAVLLALTAAVHADPPALHQRIDQAILAHAGNQPLAGPADDAEFLRRVMLDLAGTLPSATQARAFLADQDPDKRGKLIERLLGGPEHARRLADFLDVTLMERRPVKQVPQAQWLEYLRTSCAANKPWDVLVREILAADGTDPATRPAARFLLDRDGEPNLLTRDVSRLLLGTNLQCAQCHDHPRIDDYHQAHYYGIFAFFNRTSLFTDPKLKLVVLAEKADGEVTFQSVFDPSKTTKNTGPRLPDAQTIKEPTLEKGKEYVVAPANGVRPVPAWSRRAQLGPTLARADHLAFKRNIANRLWALMMGRGLVHPLDLDHSANPPSHPELLTLLADDLAEHQFDMRYLLREIALSQAYQRSSAVPPGVKEVDPATYRVGALKPLTPEQLAWSLMQATGLTDAERQALGDKATDAALVARLGGNGAPFVRAFAGPPGSTETFDARMEQALFLSNGPLLRGWLAPRPGNLTDRLARLQGVALADELYLSVFTRLPNSEERQDVTDYLANRPDRPTALREIVWGLLASTEFRFNH